MINHELPTTLQYQLREILLGKISNGEWKPGEKISSEREICEQYEVSRMTVREVLTSLQRDGILVRYQGKGTFVAKPKFEQKLGSFYSFSEEIRKSGMKASSRILEFEVISVSPKLALEMGVKLGEQLYRIERLRMINNDLFAWEQSFIPLSLIPHMTREEVEQLGLYNTIKKHSSLSPEVASETFEAVNCTKKEAELLNLKANDAVLRIVRLTEAQGICIEYCETLIRGDKYQYKVLLR